MTRAEAANMIKNDIYLHHDYLSGEYRKALKMAVSALEQPERKKGHIVNPTPYGECSECGYLIDSRERCNFCPNCGADMREEGEK